MRRALVAAHKLGLRQCDLAARLGVDERTLRRWWHGDGLRAVEALERLEAMVQTQPAVGLPGLGSARRWGGGPRARAQRTEEPGQSSGVETNESAPTPEQPASKEAA